VTLVEREQAKELMQLLLNKVEVRPFDPERDGLPDGSAGAFATKVRSKWYRVSVSLQQLPGLGLGKRYSGRSSDYRGKWLPDLGDYPNGLEFDVALYLDCGRKRIDGERRYRFPWDEPPEPPRLVSPRKRRRPNPVSIAREWRRTMEERGESRAELARRLGVTRARVTQVLKVLDLDPVVLACVERNPDPRITERALRSIVHRSPHEQLTHVDQLLASTPRTNRHMSSGRRP